MNKLFMIFAANLLFMFMVNGQFQADDDISISFSVTTESSLFFIFKLAIYGRIKDLIFEKVVHRSNLLNIGIY